MESAEDRAMRAALEIQAAYEDEIEQDSETTAFLMEPIEREIRAAQEEARADQREMDARIAEDHGFGKSKWRTISEDKMSETIAAAIRGQEEK